jgi:hypothetical protein
MKKVVIPQKMSGTGTIHDIASQHEPRVIKFRKGQEYAIVLASYYGGKGYVTTADAATAIKLDQKYKEYSRTILDSDGNPVTIEELHRLAGIWY